MPENFHPSIHPKFREEQKTTVIRKPYFTPSRFQVKNRSKNLLALTTCAGDHFGGSRPVVGRRWIKEGESTRASLLSVRSQVRPARRRPPGRIPPWCHLSSRGGSGEVGLPQLALWGEGGVSAPQNRLGPPDFFQQVRGASSNAATDAPGVSWGLRRLGFAWEQGRSRALGGLRPL